MRTRESRGPNAKLETSRFMTVRSHMRKELVSMAFVVRGRNMAERTHGSGMHEFVVASGVQIVIYNRGDKI